MSIPTKRHGYFPAIFSIEGTNICVQVPTDLWNPTKSPKHRHFPIDHDSLVQEVENFINENTVQYEINPYRIIGNVVHMDAFIVNTFEKETFTFDLKHLEKVCKKQWFIDCDIESKKKHVVSLITKDGSMEYLYSTILDKTFLPGLYAVTGDCFPDYTQLFQRPDRSVAPNCGRATWPETAKLSPNNDVIPTLFLNREAQTIEFLYKDAQSGGSEQGNFPISEFEPKEIQEFCRKSPAYASYFTPSLNHFLISAATKQWTLEKPSSEPVQFYHPICFAHPPIVNFLYWDREAFTQRLRSHTLKIVVPAQFPQEDNTEWKGTKYIVNTIVGCGHVQIQVPALWDSQKLYYQNNIEFKDDESIDEIVQKAEEKIITEVPFRINCFREITDSVVEMQAFLLCGGPKWEVFRFSKQDLDQVLAKQWYLEEYDQKEHKFYVVDLVARKEGKNGYLHSYLHGDSGTTLKNGNGLDCRRENFDIGRKKLWTKEDLRTNNSTGFKYIHDSKKESRFQLTHVHPTQKLGYTQENYHTKLEEAIERVLKALNEEKETSVKPIPLDPLPIWKKEDLKNQLLSRFGNLEIKQVRDQVDPFTPEEGQLRRYQTYEQCEKYYRAQFKWAERKNIYPIVLKKGFLEQQISTDQLPAQIDRKQNNVLLYVVVFDEQYKVALEWGYIPLSNVSHTSTRRWHCERGDCLYSPPLQVIIDKYAETIQLQDNNLKRELEITYLPGIGAHNLAHLAPGKVRLFDSEDSVNTYYTARLQQQQQKIHCEVIPVESLFQNQIKFPIAGLNSAFPDWRIAPDVSVLVVLIVPKQLLALEWGYIDARYVSVDKKDVSTYLLSKTQFTPPPPGAVLPDNLWLLPVAPTEIASLPSFENYQHANSFYLSQFNFDQKNHVYPLVVPATYLLSDFQIAIRPQKKLLKTELLYIVVLYFDTHVAEWGYISTSSISVNGDAQFVSVSKYNCIAARPPKSILEKQYPELERRQQKKKEWSSYGSLLPHLEQLCPLRVHKFPNLAAATQYYRDMPYFLIHNVDSLFVTTIKVKTAELDRLCKQQWKEETSRFHIFIVLSFETENNCEFLAFPWGWASGTLLRSNVQKQHVVLQKERLSPNPPPQTITSSNNKQTKRKTLSISLSVGEENRSIASNNPSTSPMDIVVENPDDESTNKKQKNNSSN